VPSETFAVTKDSIQLPYRRFLADSAAGLVVVLVLLLNYYFPILTPESFHDIIHSLPQNAGSTPTGTEAKVLACILIFLLATPIGFVVNAVSWLFLGHLVYALERLFYRWSMHDGPVFAFWDAAQTRCSPEVQRFFGVTEADFAVAGWLFKDVVDAYVPDRFVPQAHVKGLVIFLRNLTLLLLITAFVSLLNATRTLAPVAFMAGSLTFLLVCRWTADGKTSRTLLPGLHLLAAAAFAYSAYLAFSAGNSHRWLVQSVALFALSTVGMLVAAAMEHYYHTAILLHAYLACAELGIVEAEGWPRLGRERFLAIGESLAKAVGSNPRRSSA
jgi:hypothetical protein